MCLATNISWTEKQLDTPMSEHTSVPVYIEKELKGHISENDVSQK